jgi:integrase
MPRKRSKPPAHRRHKTHDLGYVSLHGKQVYTGPWGSEEAEEEYRRLVAEWAKGGHRVPRAVDPGTYRVRDLIADYLVHAKSTYLTPAGDPSGEVQNIRHAVGQLLRIYGSLPVQEYLGPEFEVTRQELINADLARATINRRMGIIKRMFKWGVSKGSVPTEVLVALSSVESLKRNRSRAREGKKVQPVPDADFKATLPHLTPTLADMAVLQWLTGMRSGELVAMRWEDIEVLENEEAWLYTPPNHKTGHLDKARAIPLWEPSQAILLNHQKTDRAAPIFSPAESDREFRAAKRASRQSELQPSQVLREEMARCTPKRKFRPGFDSRSYGRAIARACKAAGVPHWHPHQLRHNYATWARRSQGGLEAAQAALGHSTITPTQIYAEKDLRLALKVAKKRAEAFLADAKGGESHSGPTSGNESDDT